MASAASVAERRNPIPASDERLHVPKRRLLVEGRPVGPFQTGPHRASYRREFRDARQTEHLPPRVHRREQIFRLQRRDLEVRQQRIAGSTAPAQRRSSESLKLILGCVQARAGLSDLIELEKRLNLLRALRRLDQDEAENLAARKRDLRMVGDLLQAAFTSASAGTILGLLGAKSCG